MYIEEALRRIHENRISRLKLTDVKRMRVVEGEIQPSREIKVESSLYDLKALSKNRLVGVDSDGFIKVFDMASGTCTKFQIPTKIDKATSQLPDSWIN